MFDHVLFPTDGSDGANSVFDHVLDVAETHGATVHILHVADTAHDSVTQIEGRVVDVFEREGERIVEELADRAASRDVSVVTDVIQGGVPETILAYADRYDIDLIVMPTRGRTGLKRLFLGSVTERIVRESPVPVLTLHPDD
jgi:nucleotide-binding universal stress UspA family protein